MEKENTIETPNEVKPSDHLTEKEIEDARKMSRLQNQFRNHAEWCIFRKMMSKPKRTSKPLGINEDKKIVEIPGNPAPINKGNIRKGTLRNKKCSCGSNKKFKFCCLNRKTS